MSKLISFEKKKEEINVKPKKDDSENDFIKYLSKDYNYIVETLDAAVNGKNLYPWDLLPLSELMISSIPDGTMAHCKFPYYYNFHGIESPKDHLWNFDFIWDVENNGWRFVYPDNFPRKDVIAFLQLVPGTKQIPDNKVDILELIKECDGYKLFSLDTEDWDDDRLLSFEHSMRLASFFENWAANWTFILYFMKAQNLPKIWNVVTSIFRYPEIDTQVYFDSVAGDFGAEVEEYIEMIHKTHFNQVVEKIKRETGYLIKDNLEYSSRGAQFVSLTKDDIYRFIDYIESDEGSGPDDE